MYKTELHKNKATGGQFKCYSFTVSGATRDDDYDETRSVYFF